MATYGLIRFLHDGNHVTGLGAGLPEARLASLLRARGAAFRFYDGKSMGSVRELSRSIARMRTDVLVIACDGSTAAAAGRISSQVRALRPTLGVILWMTEPAGELLLDNGERLVVAPTPLAAADEILPSEDDARDPPLYADGVLQLAQLEQFGVDLSLPMESLAQDLALLNAADLSGRSLTFHAASLRSSEIRERLALFTNSGQCAVTVSVDPATSSEPDSVALTADGAIRVVPNNALHQDRLARSQLFAKNGTIAALSGLYNDFNNAPSIYHLEVSAGAERAVRDEAFKWASNDMAIKSAAILHRGAGDVPLADLGPVGQSRETGGWPRHVYGLEDEGERVQISVDGTSAEGDGTLRMVPLSALWNAGRDPMVTTIVTVRETQDIDALEAQLSLFQTEGRITCFHPRFQVIFENSCRYLPYGACRLALMRRVQIDEQLQLTACRDTQPISSADIDYDRLVVGVRQRQQTSEVNRNCAVCIVRDQCSRCSQLPETWEGRYCEIRNRYPTTALFFEFPYFVKTIASRLGEDGDVLEFGVSAETLPSRYFKPGERRGPPSQPVIVESASELLAWIRGTPRVIKITAPLAVILEGSWLGASDEELAEELECRFAVTPDIAATSVVEGRAKLEKTGFIHAR